MNSPASRKLTAACRQPDRRRHQHWGQPDMSLQQHSKTVAEVVRLDWHLSLEGCSDTNLSVRCESPPWGGLVELADQHHQDAQTQLVVPGAATAGPLFERMHLLLTPSVRKSLQVRTGTLCNRTCKKPCVVFCSERRRTFSKNCLASSTMLWKASSSNQHSLVIRHSSCTRLVATKVSNDVPRLHAAKQSIRQLPEAMNNCTGHVR